MRLSAPWPVARSKVPSTLRRPAAELLVPVPKVKMKALYFRAVASAA